VRYSFGTLERKSSGAKARSFFSAFSARLKSRPVTKLRFKTTNWMKTAQAVVLAVAVCFSVGATDTGARYNDLNHRLMCTCGCAEILGECNHVGCTSSTEELSLLRAGLAAGKSDKEILDSFVAKYGAVVLAAPSKEGFDLVAWIAPFAVFAAALLGTILLVRRWSFGKTQSAAQATDPAMDALVEKIRRETDGE